MNTIEGNKLIAEFDGCWLKYRNHNDKSSKYSLWLYPYNHIRHDAQNDTLDDMKYHSSWDWLMPVVEKIENWQYGICSFFIVQNECDIAFSTKYDQKGEEIYAPNFKQKGATKIEATYKTVIGFIEWYNKEQSVKESDTTKAT